MTTENEMVGNRGVRQSCPKTLPSTLFLPLLPYGDTLHAPWAPSPDNGSQEKQLLYRNEAKWKVSDSNFQLQSREGFSNGIKGNQRSARGKRALRFSSVPVALREGLAH